MQIKIDGKDYKIKFGYKPTLKEHVISKIVKFSGMSDENGDVDMEDLEELLLYLPEILLVGLQVHHKDFRYDYDTKDGKEDQLDKVFDLIDKYTENSDSSVMDLFNGLQEALLEDSFLANMFRKEKAKAGENAGQKVEQKAEPDSEN